VLPAYPQYAAATTASVADKLLAWSTQARRMPELRFVNEYHDDAGYIAALAARLRAHWAEHGRGDKLVLSFHGVPERSLLLGDPYHCQCHKTARLLAEALGLSPRSRSWPPKARGASTSCARASRPTAWRRWKRSPRKRARPS
jgi:ferrochelatase